MNKADIVVLPDPPFPTNAIFIFKGKQKTPIDSAPNCAKSKYGFRSRDWESIAKKAPVRPVWPIQEDGRIGGANSNRSQQAQVSQSPLGGHQKNNEWTE
jgi:hypothetical protein